MDDFVFGTVGTNSFINSAPSVAIFFTPSMSRLKTTRRCVVDVELYRWMIAVWAPSMASKVRRINSSGRVRTWITTSSGIRSS